VVLAGAGRAIVAFELAGVMALDRFGKLVEELYKFRGRLIREIDRQTHERQIVRFEHDVYQAAATRSRRFDVLGAAGVKTSR
jgi:hypothetical protein